MPADNIKRAIEKATGGGEAEQFEEIIYEGYGPGGVAILVEAATDNRNRTAADVRRDLHQGRRPARRVRRRCLAVRAAGADHVPAKGQDPDDVALAAIDAGAEDVDTERPSSSRSTPRRAASSRSARPSMRRACRSSTPRAR